MSYITTVTGKHFYPLEPIPQDIDIRVAERLLRSGDDPECLRRLISGLEAYYASAEWKQDFEADEAGLLPQKLKRGVLSEDGIYTLLEKYHSDPAGS